MTTQASVGVQHAAALFDRDGCLVAGSHTLTKIFVSSLDELVGKPYSELFASDNESVSLLDRARVSGHAETASVHVRAHHYMAQAQPLVSTIKHHPQCVVLLLSPPDSDLRPLHWLLQNTATQPAQSHQPQPYGDLTSLNTQRTILDAVGKDTLEQIVSEYLDMLETSSAIYEANGDYALGIFSSGWCRLMDAASRKLCNTESDVAAMRSGTWHCHESCWNEATRPALESGEPCDIACKGGIRLYAIPIRAGDEIVGGINFGYGDPPRDPAVLRDLAERYQIPYTELVAAGQEYQPRPRLIVEMAKRRLTTTAKLIGEIVQRRSAQEERERLLAFLADAVHSRDEFLSAISHELRTPLTTLHLQLESLGQVLASGIDEHKAALLPGNIEVAIRQSSRLISLVDRILDVSRVDSGRLELELKEYDFSQQIREIIARFSERAARAHCHLRADLQEPITGRWDRLHVEQIVSNLLANAIKYGPGGTIMVRARKEGRSVRLEIRDQGIGIALEDQERIFQRLERAVPSKHYGGLGLGLFITRKLIEAHGGTIAVKSESGKGATFTIELPLDLQVGAPPAP